MERQKITITVFAILLIGITTSAKADRLKPMVTRNNNVMILEYDFDEPQITTSGDYDVVTVDGLERYIEPGAPVIPTKPVQILVPAGMKIEEITCEAMDTYELPGIYLLNHGHKSFPKVYGPPNDPTPPNPEIYEMTTFWPVEQHELVTVQSSRGYNIAYVNLFPLQYAPKDGKIKMAAKMRLIISLTSIDSPRGAKPTKGLKERLQRKLDNPDTIESYDTDPTEGALLSAKSSDLEENTSSSLSGLGPYKYVVITNAALGGYSGANSFQALCDSKIVRGISAGIVTTEWIAANYDGTMPSGGSDSQTSIRNFLIDAYQTWGTEYALLAGNKDIIPARFFNAGADIAADLYYGCVDPADCTFDGDGDGIYGEANDGPGGSDVDMSADIFVGRAAVESTTEVTYFVKKTLFYETTSDPYLNHAFTSGGHLGFGGIQEYSKPWCEQVRLGSDLYLGHFACGFLSPAIDNPRDFIVETLYDADGTWDATTDMLPILNGTGGNTTPQMIYCGDHGSPSTGFTKLTTSSTPEGNFASISSLTNTRPFFFFDDSCQVGQFDVANCFSEEITVGIEYGAFACITLSQLGQGGSGDTLDSVTANFTREFFHSVLGEGIFEMGRALQDARDSLLWRSDVGGFRYAYYQETLFGDPELRLRVTKEYACGDLDESKGAVDAVDVGLFAACWLENPLTNPSCASANLVEFDKHIINLLDFSVLAELFLTESENYPPYCSGSMTDPYPPSPDPMSFATVPYATGDSSIAMVAATATDISGVEYYFTCTAGSGNDSVWQPGTMYEDTGLSPATGYNYTVKARDLSVNYNETAASGPALAMTNSPDSTAPDPNPMSFATAPYATGSSSIMMVATTATDISGVEYYFTNTTFGDDSHDSDWQDSRTYEDTGLASNTLYAYTVTARDKSVAQTQTAASDPPASATTDMENIVLPANGGVLEAGFSNYTEYGGSFVAAALTNGVTDEAGWATATGPTFDQEFAYSFLDGQDAILDRAVIHGGTGEGEGNYSKDVEVWTSADGTNFTFRLGDNDTLDNTPNDSVTIPLTGITAKKIKLKITSGYNSSWWDLAEFEVYGTLVIE